MEDFIIIPFMHIVNTIMYKEKSIRSEFITYYMAGTVLGDFTYNT